MTKISNINFRHLLNNLQAGVCRSTPGVQAKLIYANATMGNMFGFCEQEALQIKIKDFFTDPRKFQLFNKKLKEFGEVQNFEAQLKSKNTKLFWGSISAVVVKDNKGKITEFDIIIHDISLRKEVEKELLESKELFQTVFNNTAAAITVTDQFERVVAWNPFAEKMLGMGAEGLFNKKVKDFYPDKEWEKIRRLDIRSSGKHANLETKIYKKNGELLDVNVAISLIKDASGKMAGAIGIMHDISERKIAHEMLVKSKIAAEEANSAKSMFLANMSHEVRTPMNAILGMIDLTLDTSMTEEQRDNLVVAKDAADNLLGLLNDILDLSRVEAGKITLEKIEIQLHNIVKSICKGFEVVARNKGVEVLTNINEDVPELIIGDPVRIRQVLTNLINNAIKFTAKGKIIIGVEVDSKLGKEDIILRFSVKDEGIGIPEDRLESVFEVFTQADSTTTRRFGGTGLGLAICKRLVEMMSGRIWVESEVTKGSTFCFTGRFQIVQVGMNSSLSLKMNAEKDISVEEILKNNKLKALLAEDNLVNQKIARRILEKQGIEVFAVLNGKEAIEETHKKKFDFILMDSHMPILDGLETTAIIRENEKKTGGHIPIIALTARAMEDDRKKCLDGGMDGYVSKPIDRKKLFEEIIKCLNLDKV